MQPSILQDPDTCKPVHDAFALLLSSGLSVGLVISYLPQHLRIIWKKSSEGFSPWFLLLGSTSASSGFLNVVTLQWTYIECCQYVSVGSCIESLGGVIQLGLQWFLFTLILVLYLIYFPHHLKFVEVRVEAHPHHPKNCDCDPCVESRRGLHAAVTPEWKLAVTLAWVVAIHFFFCLFVTFFLVLTSASMTTNSDRVYVWATFLGVTSAILSAMQYAPQILHTYRTKLVGALSIPMMCIQSPGAALMVTSIAIRPGTNWTTWIPYAVAGVLQSSLLIMCLFWKARQQRLGIDDFGQPLIDQAPYVITPPISLREEEPEPERDTVLVEQTPLLPERRRSASQRKSWFSLW